MIQTNPTVGSNVEEVMHRNVRFQVWDLGGQDKLRKVWSTYYVGAHAVVLVVDSMDRERLDIVREELATIVAHEVPPRPRHCDRDGSSAVPPPPSGVRITLAVRLTLTLTLALTRTWRARRCSCSPTSRTSRAR